MLVSALDVRVYELAGTATAQGLKAALEFESHARQPVVQELPIVNGSAQDWSVQAMLKAEDFSGPPSLKVPANSTAYYPLEFCPSWVCERTGELVLTNQTTGDKYSFSLKGAGEEPLAEAHHVLEGQARKPQSLSLTVFNVAADGQPCELTVDSDLMHLTGAPTVAVGARAKNAGGGKGAGGVEYVLTLTPSMSGTVQGSVSFTAPDGRYLWHTIELRTTPPEAECTLDVVAPLRKVVAVEIPILNPSDTPLEFEVSVQGTGLLGDDTITVPAGPDSQARCPYPPRSPPYPPYISAASRRACTSCSTRLDLP